MNGDGQAWQNSCIHRHMNAWTQHGIETGKGKFKRKWGK